MLLLSLCALVPIIAAIGVKAGPCPGTKQEPGSRGSFAAFPNGQPHWGGPDPNFNGGVRPEPHMYKTTAPDYIKCTDICQRDPNCIGTSWFESGNSCEINFYGSTIQEVDPKYYSYQNKKQAGSTRGSCAQNKPRSDPNTGGHDFECCDIYY